MHKLQKLGLACLVVGAIGIIATSSASTSSAVAQKKKLSTASATLAPSGPKPVEPNMHEFMEYLYQPTYLRLRTALAKKPKRTAWRKIKADVLVQAEGGNLLLMRGPKNDRDTWTKMSIENRGLAAKLYAAARKRDYPTARKNWEALITNCNSCHTKFAGGKHQLKP